MCVYIYIQEECVNVYVGVVNVFPSVKIITYIYYIIMNSEL